MGRDKLLAETEVNICSLNDKFQKRNFSSSTERVPNIEASDSEFPQRTACVGCRVSICNYNAQQLQMPRRKKGEVEY